MDVWHEVPMADITGCDAPEVHGTKPKCREARYRGTVLWFRR